MGGEGKRDVQQDHRLSYVSSFHGTGGDDGEAVEEGWGDGWYW